ncbi:MAG: Gfo/Idh/MocA family oxidoreductase [Rhodothermales bacterium]|nr:Gfo/Idh/MocA family oxidoreductase [Rhodothermales bacterium]
MDRKIRYAMVGGGPGAFIGGVHRMAAGLDGMWQLVGGAFSSDAARSAEAGRALHLDPDRVYGSWQQLIEAEAARPAGERIDAVSIVTPNHLHFPVADLSLDAGFHVVCDKPMTITLDDAEALCARVHRSGLVFALTHNYTGYPMVKQARHMASGGELGELRKVVVEYPQGWLSTLLEETGQKQAEWRADPERAGISSALGDIGTHCENLVHYVTGLEMEELFADLGTMVEGRAMEDDASLLIRYRGGARGILYASQVSIGEENALTLRVYGTKAAIEWRQEEPNRLIVKHPDRPAQVYLRGNGYLCEAARRAGRIPPGHPEGFIEAFANIYANAGGAIAAHIDGREPDELDLDFPTVFDGARGVHFIHSAVASSREHSWIDMTYDPEAACRR